MNRSPQLPSGLLCSSHPQLVQRVDFFAAKRSPKETKRSRSWTVRNCPRTRPSQKSDFAVFGVETTYEVPLLKCDCSATTSSTKKALTRSASFPGSGWGQVTNTKSASPRGRGRHGSLSRQLVTVCDVFQVPGIRSHDRGPISFRRWIAALHGRAILRPARSPLQRRSAA